MAAHIHDNTYETWKWTLVSGGALLALSVIAIWFYAS
jgi:hypothetical protein